jgi:hypothetical protein
MSVDHRAHVNLAAVRALVLTCLSIVLLDNGTLRAFSAPNHDEITKAALSFLRPDVVDDLIANNVWVDNNHPGQNYWHFDGCNFAEGSANIQSWYVSAAAAFNPDRLRLQEGREAFGHILHPIQDIYAHSNWVDLAKRTLLSPRPGPWTLPSPYARLDEAVVVEGETTGVTLQRDGRVVTVTTSQGQFPGLITGTWLGPGRCPSDASMAHDDLNKDADRSLNHAAARALATKQTRREWCRLVQLVGDTYGTRGTDALLNAWVQDRPTAEATCRDVDETFSIFVDGSSREDEELGTDGKPFHSVRAAGDMVPAGSSLQISTGTYAETGIYANSMTMRGRGGSVTIGR